MKKKPKDPKDLIPAWAGWNDYFSSADGRRNICVMLQSCMKNKARNNESDYSHDIEPSALAIELVTICPDLKELIPADVLTQVGDFSAAIDLAKFVDDPHMVHDARQCVRTSIVLMSRGISRVEIAYTGGSDECTTEGTTVVRSPIDSDKEVAYSDSEELSCFMSAWGIDIDCFWMFCDDSGAGDGSGYWTGSVVAELVPEFNGYTSEPEFYEYECENCEEPLSQCSCTRCSSCYEPFTPDEAKPNELMCDGCREQESDRQPKKQPKKA